MNRDYYADLGLTQNATSLEIKTAFHTLALQHHPDKTGDADTSAFRCVREAFEKLTDPTFKREYDNDYANMRFRFDADSGPKKTRTEAYKTEKAREVQDQERAATEAYEETLRRSPPPNMPTRKTNESGTAYYLGRAYQAWERRDAAYRKKHPMYEQA
jgi:curved DNA-binding protein CbpA